MNVARRAGRQVADPEWTRVSHRLARRRRMRSRLVIVTATAVAAAAIVATVVRFASPSPAAALAGTALPTGTASYLGVYESGPPQTYQPVTDFARTVGRAPNLVGYYSGWKEPFQTSFAQTVHAHGAVTVVQIDPTDFMVSKIAAGYYDSYLRSYADSVRRFGQPVVIGFGHEMNAPWYTWGYGQMPARDVRGRVAARGDVVPRPGRAQRHLAVDPAGGRARYRADDRALVARQPVRHLGWHRRLLLPPVGHVQQRIRQDHHPGADPDRQAHPAVGGRRRTAGRPVREDRRPVQRDARSTARSG